MERTRNYVIKPVIFAELICEVLVMIVLFGTKLAIIMLCNLQALAEELN